jgi:hypothetical protein
VRPIDIGHHSAVEKVARNGRQARTANPVRQHEQGQRKQIPCVHTEVRKQRSRGRAIAKPILRERERNERHPGNQRESDRSVCKCAIGGYDARQLAQHATERSDFEESGGAGGIHPDRYGWQLHVLHHAFQNAVTGERRSF